MLTGCVVERIVPPPSLRCVVIPWPADGAEHIATHDPGADPFKAPDHHVIMQASHSSVLAAPQVVSASRKLPTEDRETAYTYRIGRILVELAL
jgi:hypothetical protein